MKKYFLIMPSLILGGLLFLSPLFASEVDEYWSRPLPSQGTPPSHFSPLEKSLNPEACNFCHKAQYDQWKTALHSKSMGPGILGQLLDMNRTRNAIDACTTCHAPLAEQMQEFLEGSIPESLVFPEKKGLFEKGLTCAACHIRKFVRYGPSVKDETTNEKLPHNGFVTAEWFHDSKFCKSCHQFPNDGYALNGKLLENTYNEWLESPYAKKNVTCQSCHMPDRKHLWRGIHDKEMTKKGLDINVENVEADLNEKIINAIITVRNVGVGHFFPTYVTPLVVVKAFMVDKNGKILEKTLMKEEIGRHVPLSLDVEEFDTRIEPDGVFKMEYEERILQDAKNLRVEIVVYPDEFYTRFYKNILGYPSVDKGRTLIEKALDNSLKSIYILFEKDIPITAN